MKLYSTLSGQKEEFTPESKNLGLYLVLISRYKTMGKALTSKNGTAHHHNHLKPK